MYLNKIMLFLHKPVVSQYFLYKINKLNIDVVFLPLMHVVKWAF